MPISGLLSSIFNKIKGSDKGFDIGDIISAENDEERQALLEKTMGPGYTTYPSERLKKSVTPVEGFVPEGMSKEGEGVFKSGDFPKGKYRKRPPLVAPGGRDLEGWLGQSDDYLPTDDEIREADRMVAFNSSPAIIEREQNLSKIDELGNRLSEYEAGYKPLDEYKNPFTDLGTKKDVDFAADPDIYPSEIGPGEAPAISDEELGNQILGQFSPDNFDINNAGDIRRVQQQLVDAGYKIGTTGEGGQGVDAVFGYKTQEAYRDYVNKLRKRFGRDEYTYDPDPKLEAWRKKQAASKDTSYASPTDMTDKGMGWS